ncbi:MAG: hypothetical protein EG828_11195 [Deltaproteobacteria bacterium]|nr:hypothetical protein [Deltaproteobacteria bacterium]
MNFQAKWQQFTQEPPAKQIADSAPFDRQKWGAEIERVTRAVCERFSGSLRDWMKDKRPDLYQRLKQAENDIDGGYDQEDAPQLKAALAEYVTVLEIAANETRK